MRYRLLSAVAALVIATAAWAQAPAPAPPAGPPTAGQAPPAVSPDAVAHELCVMNRSSALVKAESDAAAIIAQNLRTIRERDARIATLEAEVAKLKATPK